METSALRDFSAFKGWHFRSTGLALSYTIWCETRCDECWKPLVLNSYTVTAFMRELTSAKLIDSPACPSEQAHIPFAGGPCLCETHYKAWLEGKVLPTDCEVQTI